MSERWLGFDPSISFYFCEVIILSTKVVYRGPDTLFYNSQCLFIEYHDALQSPWYILLAVLMQHEGIKSIFDFSDIEGLNPNELYEWYVNRKERNIFKNFEYIGEGEGPSDKDLDELLHKNELASDIFYNTDDVDSFLNFWHVLEKLAIVEKSLIKKIYIYTETENPYIEKVLKEYFGNANINYVFGQLKDILKGIPRDSTYVFSDIEKVNMLKELDKLAYSSILICDGYRYNKNKDGKLKVDLEKESKDIIFKYAFFNGIYEN